MNLTTSEVKSYLHCPYYYKFRWVDSVPLFKVRAKEYWFDALKSCALDFFKTWISFEKPKLEELQGLWQKAWYEEPLALEWRGTAKNETKQSLGNQGWVILTKLYRWAESRQMIMGGASFPFSIDVNDDQLTGTIDLLLYTDASRTNFEAIKFVKSSYEATKMQGHNDIELTAWRMTLKKLTNLRGGFEPLLKYYVLENIQQPLILTHRNDNQQTILEDTVKAISNSIKGSLYYPHYGNRCLQCDYKDLCNKGKWQEED